MSHIKALKLSGNYILELDRQIFNQSQLTRQPGKIDAWEEIKKRWKQFIKERKEHDRT